jgi:hypothetical protein
VRVVPRRRLGTLRQADVEALLGEPLLEQGRLLRGDRDARLRVRRSEASDRLGQERVRERGKAGDGESALGELAQAHRRLGDALEAHVGAFDLLEQGERAHRRSQPAAHAVEETQAERGLEARQLAADRGLRRAERLGGAGHVGGAHDGAEHLDLAVGERHGPGISGMNEL